MDFRTPPQHPFYAGPNASFPELYTNATVALLCEEGVSRFSVGALARRLNITPPALLNRSTRAELLLRVGRTFLLRWESWSLCWGGAQPLRLPQTEEELDGVRVYVMLDELARGERLAGRTDLAEAFAGGRAEETAALRNAAPPGESEAAILGRHALVTGLRVELARPGTPLTWEQATGVLGAALDRTDACADSPPSSLSG